jgi:type I restriction-modification system DNA methylase subunit
MKNLFLKEYLKQIAETTAQGDAREESYYEFVKQLFQNYGEAIGKSNIHITILPKKTDAGNPDFRIWDGKQHIVGYIEAKIPDANLDIIETSEQLQRYRETFPNLILTNYYEFRLYRNGQIVKRAEIGRKFTAQKLQLTPALEHEEDFYNLMESYFSFSLPKTYSASSLAVELAKRTRFLKDEIVWEELREESKGKGDIIGFYEAFRQYLITGLSKEEFADLYSQTITYGLFAARTRANSDFNRELAFQYIPTTIGILRDVFRFISLGKVPLQMQVIIDDIAEVLQAAETNKILHQFYKEGKGKDPIIHFYETFLSKYDPTLREQRGVYYTPEPVVRYIVNAIHQILKRKFKLVDGLADESITLLDPAGGTLTFPAEAIKIATAEYIHKYGDGNVKNFIKNNILKNYYAFELMMAPYAIGHLKIGFLLDELGYKLQDDDRFKLYLTNTLEVEDIEQSNIPGLSSLSEESMLAGNIKKSEPILVILGNPPYSGFSANSNDWTEKLLKQNIDGALSYYEVDGKPLGEKNPKWLQDDYVKFLRFAQWKIHKAGKGIVGMITNHSYLDNPTFRGMRQSLMNTFNEIYILDLHGNSLKKETTPSGGKDENVFDIRQGTAIALFVKQEQKSGCKVFHLDLFGLRDDKYRWLEKNDFCQELYEKIHPQSPYYFFIKRDTENIQNYLKWHKITDIFPVNSVGIVTARDKLTIQWSENDVLKTIMHFSSLEPKMARIAYNLGKDVRDWKVNFAQKDLVDSELDRNKVVPILYRPFDTRYTYYTGKSRGFLCMPRPEVMQHMLERENIGLITTRQMDKSGIEPVFISDKIIDSHSITSAVSISYFFPLYLHPPLDKHDLFVAEGETKKVNIAFGVLADLKRKYKKQPEPEEILYYIYAVLYSNIFREKYAEFLKIDFPRVPFVKSYDLFEKAADLGKKLAQLHLLKSSELNYPISKFKGEGDDFVISKPVYKSEEERIYINREKYFDNVTEEVWNYHIGGYQVLAKYLKSRKGRKMEEVRHFCKVITALQKTIELQNEIDVVFLEMEKSGF